MAKRNDIKLGTHGEDYGNWMSTPVFYVFGGLAALALILAVVSFALLHIPTPGAYVRDKDGVMRENKKVKYPYSWFQTTVRDVLSNEVYIGNMVSLKFTSKSFKDKKLIARPESEHIRVENTHEPLVDKELSLIHI